jgi:uncharacterized protein (TIGR04255 family)
MVEPRHLPNAPITEAIIDLRVNKSDGESLEKSLDRLKEHLGDKFPNAQSRRGFETGFVFQFGRGARQHMKDTGFDGYLFTSQDGLNLVQFRPDGFTYNRLKPYTSWDEIYPEAINLWKLYVEVAKPELVVRTALRYINHLKLPLPIDDLHIYLSAMPALPEGQYQIEGFLTRLVLFNPTLDVTAAVGQALEPGPTPEYAIYILDIDAFKEEELEPLGGKVPETLGRLRAMKNYIFFGSITEETVRLLDGN